MKKIILFLSLITLAFACGNPSKAQERTISKTMPTGTYYYKYTGVAADTLKATNQDTIDFVITYQSPEYIQKIAVKTRFDIIAGADTTVSTSVYGKEFSDDATYVSVIGATTSSAVTANNTVQILTCDPYTLEAGYVTGRVAAGDTTNVAHNHTPFDFSYRVFRIRYILQGNDSVGTGIKIDEIEFKVYTQ